MVTITISNITFTVKQDTSVTFAEAVHGSYTVKNTNGETLNIGTAYPVESITKFTVDAIPAEGYKFLRWEVAGGAQLSPEQSGELMVPTGGTVQPVFVTNDTPIFRVGTQAFGDLGEAIDCAQGENSAKIIVMTSDGALEADATYTIPAGVTLLVPYADARITETYMEQTPEESSGQNPWTINPDNDAGAPYANRGRTDPARSGADVLSPVMDPTAKVHRTLTIPATTTVRIEKDGVFSVGGVMSGGGHGTVAAAGGIIGQHSNIQLDGSIEVAGVFSCNGFVLGSGSITTKSGGAIYEPFVVMDFHAGSWSAANLGSGSPMFLRYTMPNIQTSMTISFGAKLYGYCDLVGGNQHNVTTGVIIGAEESSLIVLENGGNVQMTYADTKKPSRDNGGVDVFASVGKSTLTITGGAHYGSLVLNANGFKLQSREFPLALPYNIDLVLEDGNFSINKHFYILPGANLTVGSGATLAIGTEAFYSSDQSDGRVSFAVFDGLEEHTNHNSLRFDATDDASRTQAYAYPLPAELENAGFNPIGGLTVAGGGTLKIESYAKFGGYVQASGENATITTSPVAELTATASIGLWKYEQDDKGNTNYYLGKTSHTLPAKVADTNGSFVAMQTDYTYTSTAVDESRLTSFTFGLYNTKTHQGDKTPTSTTYPATGQAFNATVSGRFSGEKAGNKVQLIQASGASSFFATVAAAVTNADAGAVIKLVANLPEADAVSIGVGKEVTLDLNGYTLTGTITNGGTLTIVDSGATKGKITASSATLLANSKDATLSLEGVTLELSDGRSATACVKNAGTINYISGCTLTADKGKTLWNSAKILKIEYSELYTSAGGTTSYVIYNVGSGMIGEITACTVTTKKGFGIENQCKIEKITNCNIKSDASKDAIQSNSKNAQMTIIGGTYTATGGNSVNVSSGKVTIYEGRFKGKGGAGITGSVVEYPIGNLSATPDNDGYYWVGKSSGYTITVSGSGIADVSLDGMGSGYTATDKVTVAAPEVKGYTFNGWCRSGSEKSWRTDLVVKTTVAQMLADGLFDENGEANLVAKYAPKTETTNLTLTLNKASGATVSWNGTPQTSTNDTWNVPVGTVVTITVNDPNFQYWTNANDKVMSRETEYTFTMVTNTTLSAETNDSTSTTFVIFQSADGRLLSVQSDLSNLQLPDAPYRVGYKFAGWRVNGAAPVPADEVADNLKSQSGPVTVTAAYEEITAGDLSVTVYVDGKEDVSKTQNNLSLGEIATFTAAPTANNKTFRFWASDVNGTDILSFSRTYSFRVTQTTTIYAIYGGENNPTAQPVVRVDDVLKNGSPQSLTFMIGASIPEGYQLVEMGALYAKGSGTDEQLRVEKVGTGGVLKAVSKLTQQEGLTDYSYALGFKISENNASSTICLRGYVAVKKTGDNTGTIYYYYSGVTSKSYSELSAQQGG